MNNASSSWSSYRQFRRLLEGRSTLDPASLYEQAESLSDVVSSSVFSQAVQTLDSPGAVASGTSNIRWCRFDGTRRPRWQRPSGRSASDSRTDLPRFLSTATSRRLSMH